MKILSSHTKAILYIPWQIKKTHGLGMTCINDNRILIFGLTIPLMDWVLNMHLFDMRCCKDTMEGSGGREKESSSTWHNEELYDLCISEEGCCMKGSSLISILRENEKRHMDREDGKMVKNKIKSCILALSPSICECILKSWQAWVDTHFIPVMQTLNFQQPPLQCLQYHMILQISF